MKNKIGVIFIVTIFALAGLGITYSGFTDSISIYGTVNTATVDLEIHGYSGTWAWKVFAEEDEIVVTHDPSFSVPPEQGFLVAYGKGRPVDIDDPAGYDAIIEFEDIFPCIDFEADIIFKYTGTIPCIISEIEWDWTGDLIDLNGDEVPETDFIEYLQQLYIDTNGEFGLTGGFYRCDETGYLTDPVEDVIVGTQIHPDEYFKLIVLIHLPQDDRLQNLAASGYVNIEVIQWNDMCDDQQTGEFASISDFVWNDLNKDGIQDPGEPGIEDVEVNLYYADGSYVSTTTTDDTGYYIFDGLLPGDYYLVFTLPIGFAAFTSNDQGVDDEVDSDVDQITGQTVVTTLEPGENDVSWDAGLIEECIGSIGDFVWEDLNNDGIQDPGEPGIEGVVVNLLYPVDDSELATTTTDSNGLYYFTNLGAGQYKIEFILPDGYVFTIYQFGNDPSIDSDADPVTGKTTVITIGCGEDDDTWDAGLVDELYDYEGCSHGFWKNHHSDWMYYQPIDLVGDVFIIPTQLDELADDTLDDALRYNGGTDLIGGAEILLRNAVASVLNAAHDNVNYPMTLSEVINDVNSALASLDRDTMLTLEAELDIYNNLEGCIC